MLIPESFLSGHGSLILSGDADLRSYYYTEVHRGGTELHGVIEQMISFINCRMILSAGFASEIL